MNDYKTILARLKQFEQECSISTIQSDKESIYVFTYNPDRITFDKLLKFDNLIQNIMPKDTKYIFIPDSCSFKKLSKDYLIEIRNVINKYIEEKT